MEMVIELIAIVIGSNAFTAYVQHKLNKKGKSEQRMTVIKDTMAAVTYTMLANEIEKLLSKGFATSDERKAIGILYDAYKANGWNGDMESRMSKVYALRTDKPGKAQG